MEYFLILLDLLYVTYPSSKEGTIESVWKLVAKLGRKTVSCIQADYSDLLLFYISCASPTLG